MPEPVVELRLGKPTLLLKEPADIRFVLEEQPENFEKSPRLVSARGQSLSGSGVLTSRGEHHRKLRESLHPIFTRPALNRHTDSIVESTSDLINRWRDETTVECGSEMEKLTEGIIGKILFPGGYGRASNRLVRSLRLRKRYLQYRFEMPFVISGVLPVPLAIRYYLASRVVRDELTARIAEEFYAGRESSLIGQMLSAELTSAEVFEEALTLAITGYETVAVALTWALWLLATHLQEQTRARDEARRTLAESSPSSAAAPNFPFLSMVVSESMRLYPPTWLIVRIAKYETMLPGGYRVRAGSKMYLSPWVVHRDARYYSEPLRFSPERFLPSEIAARPKLSYFPFGAGPRLCLGNHLARIELTLILALLLREFEFIPIPGQKVHPSPKITLRPSGPVMFTLKPAL